MHMELVLGKKAWVEFFDIKDRDLLLAPALAGESGRLGGMEACSDAFNEVQYEQDNGKNI